MESSESSGEITWIFSAEVLEHKTPSREDGISWETERKYRREGARFIINASNTLKLRRDSLATGAVFFHRFFMVQSFKDFDRWVVACTCMLLAGKVEEMPKQCRSIIKVAQQLLTNDQMKGFGSNPKEEILCHERVLLQTIRFDLQVDHPYDYLLKFAQSLKGEKTKIESVLQMAWTFINDSLCTTLCLQWEPPAIAVAMLYLSGKLSKFDLQSAAQGSYNKRSWWRQFVGTVDLHDLESICHQVLDVYGGEQKPAKEEEEKSSEVLTDHLAAGSSNGPPPPPPPAMTPLLQSGQHPQPSSAHLSSSTQLSYTAQSLQQAMGSHHMSHTQQIGVPQGGPINPQPIVPVGGVHVGTPPSVMAGVYQQSMINQPSNSYTHSIGGTHYQAGLQIQHGVSHVNQVGGVGSRYTAGVSPSGAMVSPIPSRPPPQPQQGSLYPASVVPGTANVPTTHDQSHYHHHQTYHSASGSWR